MDDFFNRISHPALTDIRLEGGGLEVTEVLPRRIPDLFVGRPVAITGRFSGESRQAFRITGQAGGRSVAVDVPVEFVDGQALRGGLPSVWARMKIADLCDEAIREANPDLPRQIRQLALDYQLLSAYTACVAVDSSRRTEGKQGTTVPVAVPVPDGVRYDTTVTE
jgi:Ca-activated chloride channel homolog